MNIIYHMIDLISSDNLYGVSEEIEIAKGKNKLGKINFIRNLFFIKSKLLNGRKRKKI